MDATLLAVGSRGDVLPMMALAMGLRAAGHRARVAALDPFAEMITAEGIEFVSLGAMPQRFTKPLIQLPVPTFNGLSGRALFWFAYNLMLGSRLPAFERACRQGDTLVFGGLAFPAYHLAEASGARAFWAAPTPHTATGAFADPFFTHRWYAPKQAPRRSPSATNAAATHTRHNPRGWRAQGRRLSYHAEEQLRLQATLRRLNHWRATSLALPRIPRHHAAKHFRATVAGFLYSSSPQLLPPPSDWPANAHVTGAWSAPRRAEWAPPSHLAAFLADGPAPIYLGFGSMSGREPERLGRLVVEALGNSGQRAVVSGLRFAPNTAPDTIALVDEVPHEWLFRRVSLAVHHGGAGTSAAAALAGTPSLVVPLAYDQHFWAQQLYRRGVAAPPLPRQQLTAARLAACIEQALANHNLCDAARALREVVATEDGVARAVAILESTR